MAPTPVARSEPPRPGSPDSGAPLDRREEHDADALEARVLAALAAGLRRAKRAAAGDVSAETAARVKVWVEAEHRLAEGARRHSRRRPPPPRATRYPPGDVRRVAVMYQRHRDGYLMTHPGDARWGDPEPRHRPDDPPEPELPT